MCEGEIMRLRVWWWKIKQLTKEDLKNEDVIANAYGLEIFEDGEWSEYYDEKGRNIDKIMEEGIESV